MRSKNPELMDKIQKFVEKYYLDFGHSPSTSVLSAGLGIGRTTAYRYLLEMDEKGMIEYDGHNVHTPVTRKINKDSSQTAIIGSVPCGSPDYEEENIEEYISLPTAIFGSGDFYILRASGDSMIDAGIEDDDLVVIRKQNTANEGDIIVALVDGQNTLKRFYRDNENKKVILRPENKEYKDIIVDECFIQGVACKVIKNL